MANVYDIIIRPIITERSMEATSTKKYVFCLLYTSDAADE